MSLTHERHFEDHITSRLVARGWREGDATDYDRSLGLFPNELVAWLRESQPDTWKELEKRFGADATTRVMTRLRDALHAHGTPRVLRRGFDVGDVKIEVAAFEPTQGLNPALVARVAKNRLTVTRQVRFAAGSSESVDLVLALSGVPVATMELKSKLAGSTVEDAVAQYKGRPPGVGFFRPREGAVVHFAVDSDAVSMATELAGEPTRFVPFNKGTPDGGAGNPRPADENDHRTAYLWEEVLERRSALEILHRFAQVARVVERKGGKKTERRVVLFPRWHQLDAVRALVAAARADGPGRRYLVQHSAGSGKSNTIAWLAWRLANLHDDSDARVFDAVLVVTDRRVLDDQLGDTIAGFDGEPRMFADVDGARQLKAALKKGEARILAVTLQTFPYLGDVLEGVGDRRFAVIIDEAHSSQGGEAAGALHEALAGGDATPADEPMRRYADARQHRNQSLFAFTATPRPETLQLFGRPDGKGGWRAFHTYTMRQAIEEGFILDVLTHYTPVGRDFELEQTGEDVEVPAGRAAATVMRVVSLDPKTLRAKVDLILDHFEREVRHELAGRARAMVVTAGRLHAVRFHETFRARIAARKIPQLNALVAFSGTVDDDTPGSTATYTEAGLNGFPEPALPGEFEKDPNRILVVASKYQTGFDQPLLQTMYVDRALHGIQAVQTLCRLNRVAPGKERVYVVDFVNNPEDVLEAFREYRGVSWLRGAPTADHLAVLAARLDGAGVYDGADLAAWEAAYTAQRLNEGARQAKVVGALGPAADRYGALGDDEQGAFSADLVEFASLYPLLAPWFAAPDAAGERRYRFLCALDALLPRDARSPPPLPDLRGRVRVVRYDAFTKAPLTTGLGDAAPEPPGDAEAGAAGGEGGLRTRYATSPQDERTARLSVVVETLNQRFGSGRAPGDVAALEEVLDGLLSRKDLIARARRENEGSFTREKGYQKAVRGLFYALQDAGVALGQRFVDEAGFEQECTDLILREFWQQARASDALEDDLARLATLSVRRAVLERALRAFVKRGLAAAHGDDGWFEPVRALLPSDRRKQVAALAPDVVLAQRLYLTDLILVVEQHWNAAFAPLIESLPDPLTRDEFVARLRLVAAHRNDAHARSIAPEDLDAVLRAVDRLEAVLAAATPA